MKITQTGAILTLEITPDLEVSLYCRSEYSTAGLAETLREYVVDADATVALSSGILLDFDSKYGLQVERP